MAFENFDFPYHRYATEYPNLNAGIQFGKGWQHSAAPSGRGQRVFKLTFPTMCRYVNSNGTINTALSPYLNLGRFEAFYDRHETWKPFYYPHPVYGPITCRFQNPLQVPEGEPGGNGTVKDVQVAFIEMPGVSEADLNAPPAGIGASARVVYVTPTGGYLSTNSGVPIILGE